MGNSDSSIKVEGKNEEQIKKQRSDRFKTIRKLLIFAGLVLTIRGCNKCIDNYHMGNIKAANAQYPNGATLIAGELSDGRWNQVGDMWLDLDGDTNTTEALIWGNVDSSLKKRVWKENHAGDKRSLVDWAARVEYPRIQVLPGNTRE